MANTYTLISSNVLGSNAASVTFSSIPNTYTDLVVRTSIRSNSGAAIENVNYRFNSDSATNYSWTTVYGDGSSVSSNRSTNTTSSFIIGNGGTSTANTFSNAEIYIPSYTSSTNKPNFFFGAQENYTSSAVIKMHSNSWRNTAVINSIILYPGLGTNFVTNSSFYLYGIKNS